MKKLMATMGVMLFLTMAFLGYHYLMRDEMRLRRLGYTQAEISLLLDSDQNLVQNLVNREERSEYIMEFLNVTMFNWLLYDEYIQFANEHSHLDTEDVVSTVSFLNHIFKPTLVQAGYEEEILETWSQSEQFFEYVSQANLVALNNLLSFAQLTGSELNVLYKYMDYESRSPHLEIDEIINKVDFYKMTVLPELVLRGYTEEEINKIYQQFEIRHFNYLLETNLTANQTLELMSVTGFNPENLIKYEEVLTNQLELGATYAVQSVRHPNVKGNFYEQIVETPNQSGLLALVNRNFRLNYNYRPHEFAKVNVPVSSTALSNSNFLRKEAAIATEELFSKASEAGHPLILSQGFVSFETQQQLYSQYSNEMIEGLNISKIPRAGHSEHQTGLAIGITTAEKGEILSTDFALTMAGQWVKANAHNYGFIIRYPEGRESETGMPFKPYHLRYVGVEVATEIFENNWILEDYILIHELLENEQVYTETNELKEEHFEELMENEEVSEIEDDFENPEEVFEETNEEREFENQEETLDVPEFGSQNEMNEISEFENQEEINEMPEFETQEEINEMSEFENNEQINIRDL